jgi:hypothetical protein
MALPSGQSWRAASTLTIATGASVLASSEENPRPATIGTWTVEKYSGDTKANEVGAR